MRRNFVLVGLLLLVLSGLFGISPSSSISTPTPAHAQRNQYWDDGCDARVIDAIADTTDTLDYRQACADYQECLSNELPICQFYAFQRMLEQCPVEDQQCHDGAILFAAAILAFDYPAGEWTDWVPPQTVIDGVPAGLAAFWDDDDAAALAAYQLTSPEDHYLDIAMPLSRAVLYQRLDQPDMALVEYDTIFGFVFTDPLARYVRSQFYAGLGRLEEASFDVAALDTFEMADPALNEFVESLQAQYPLDDSIFQDWLYYPLTASSQYVVNEVNDLSLVPPRPVRLGVYEDLNLVVTIGLKNWTSDGFSGSDDILQILHRTDDPTRFTLTYPAYWENYGAISVTQVAENVFRGFEEIGFFEGYGAWEFMLAPADAPDPRLALNEKRYCEGSVISRLAIGAVVTGIDYSDRFPLLMTDTPDGAVIGDVKVPHEGYITVVGGPECVGEVTWWEGIHTDGTRGWFGEHVDTMYYAVPTTMRPEILFCQGSAPALPPRLSVGTSAVVVPDLGANNVRREPAIEAESLGAIPPNATVAIIGGPVCIEDTVWWYADYDGLIGWTVEGQAPTYWLAPVDD